MAPKALLLALTVISLSVWAQNQSVDDTLPPALMLSSAALKTAALSDDAFWPKLTVDGRPQLETFTRANLDIM